MIETELRRAFRSRGMLVVVLVAVILAAGNLYSSLQMDRHFAEIRKMMLEQHDVTYYPYIAFEKYIGVREDIFWQNTSPHMSAVPLQCYYR